VKYDSNLRYALVCLIQEDLGHAFDCNGERDDGVFTACSTCAMAPTGAECTEHCITGLTEQQFLQHIGLENVAVIWF
jgi:hypothetical protein